MAALSLSIDAIKPMNRWANSSIRPGVVGSVGDVLLTPKFKHSMPDLPIRYDPYFRGNKESRLGSNVQDGTEKSFDSGGLGPRTIDSNWGGRRKFKVRNGYIFQDMRPPDKYDEPVLGSTPQYSFLNKVATVYNAKRTGENFLPLPGEYEPKQGQVPRGGAYPYTRAIAEGTEPPNPQGIKLADLIGDAIRKRGLLPGPHKPNKRMK
jgi:hypothetical protein